ncbi:hypothetical protein ACS0TY_030385 [Phlomoides rotata]
MAAFPSSYQQQLLHDSSSSLFLHNPSPSLSPINFDQPNTAFHNEEQQTSVFSVTNKNSMDTSSVITDKLTHNLSSFPLDNINIINIKKRKSKHSSSPNSAQSKDMREVKGKKQRKDCEYNKKAGKEAPAGYIHVRARRGQATDSHSLAERVRRERISERMKLLQALVPGCDKVTGKALMLDEIINYVQSLQNQVEFLSMKLASVNPMLYDFGMDLESLMVRPDQSLVSPFQVDSPTTSNTYPLLDNSFLLQQIPYALPQGEKQVLWGVDEQTERQKTINQSGFNNNSFFSFPLM